MPSATATVAKSMPNANSDPHHFRARPWPVVLGGHADLRTKARRYPSRGRDQLSSFAVMVDCLEETKDGVHGLFDDERWRKRMWSYCDGSGTSDDFMSEAADDAFLELEEDMRYDDEWSDRPCAAERCLLEFLMEHHIPSLTVLLDGGHVHLDNDLFEPCTMEWQSFSGGEPESLLAMAAKHICSPEVVRLLLARGADPNAELVHLSFNGAMLPTCGPGGLAWNDVNRHWCGDEAKKVEILTALGEAGGEMFDVYNAYWSCEPPLHAQRALSACLYNAEIARKRADAKQRLETVVALVGIVSFWRRAAAAPESKAAKAAIRRVAKRAREPVGRC